MVRHYTRWTKELLEPVVQSSQSYAECLKKLGLRVVGGNYSNLQRNIDKFNISTDHMLHQAHIHHGGFDYLFTPEVWALAPTYNLLRHALTDKYSPTHD